MSKMNIFSCYQTTLVYVKLSPFHFNLNRENIVAKIEGAGVKAIERLNLLKAELIKDTVSHINSQVQI